jgi:hypothetical protein
MIFTGTDTINETIWKESTRIHARPGFTPADLNDPERPGAQQAMLDPALTPCLGTPSPVLPWVPDLLGEHWTHECGVVIIGQNYGQFITGYTARPKRMSAQAYANATTWQDFQRTFIPDVVVNDNDYYEKLAPLLRATGSNDRFVVTDLIRCTLVERGAAPRPGVTTRSDKNIDLNLPKHRDAYAAYADIPESRDWLCERIIGTKSRTIIALGRAPYCGLLRLFASKKCTITDHKSGNQWRYRGAQWMYNCGINSIEGRLTNGDWHDVHSPALQRSWAIILVAHPATENNDYKTAVPVINAARQANGC